MYKVITLFVFILFFPNVANSNSLHQQTKRTDGSTIDWYIDRPAPKVKTGLIILIQGSGCEPVTPLKNIKRARKLFSDYTTLTIDKYGVSSTDGKATDLNKTCSDPYYAHNTMSQRVSDYVQIVTSLQNQNWWNKKLILLGGSEGGIVASRLAVQIHAQAVILISTSGGVTFGEMVKQSIFDSFKASDVSKDQRPDIDALFSKIRQNPTSKEIWAGNSYRFWADAIDRRAADDMLKSDSALLLIQGSKDKSGAVDMARKVSDLFAAAHRCNLTYWEFPDYDHTMTDSTGHDEMPGVLKQASLWAKWQLARSAPAASCYHP